MFKIEKTVEISAAHYLTSLPKGHKCGRMHGHNYKIIVTFEATFPDEAEMVCDFGLISSSIEEQYDHHVLNDRMDRSPTAENFAREIFSRLAHLLGRATSRVVSVRVYETDDCWAEFTE